MSFAKLVGEISCAELMLYKHFLIEANWEIVEGRDYQTFDITEVSGHYRAFFLKLPPGGRLHRHIDAGDVQTDHLIIQTNDQCLNWWLDGEHEYAEHLREGYQYKVNRTLMHWATNYGVTDRIHLLIETK